MVPQNACLLEFPSIMLNYQKQFSNTGRPLKNVILEINLIYIYFNFSHLCKIQNSLVGD